ncbi:DUF6841 family protein [Pseudochryseolinea flava]|uniref:DUF6841 domain-containing protein n=1 Tax=Pseudochryseolinea flava TaxID=2059302 RepID=A0A364Y5S5_9BACT|nr:hypothetical protein [Pseudochryseolinea flava]RAW02346.1 hypothetical protein DQQ10_07380 [Pseudochryseolinea flava]
MTTALTFFENYAKALMSYSPEDIASFYAVPVTIFSDQGSRTVTDKADTIAFWKEAVKPYAAQNIVKAVPITLTEEQLSKNIWVSKVIWTNSDSEGKVVANETNFYILSDEGEGMKIIGLILMSR